MTTVQYRGRKIGEAQYREWRMREVGNLGSTVDRIENKRCWQPLQSTVERTEDKRD
jgi:hypothetical protein